VNAPSGRTHVQLFDSDSKPSFAITLPRTALPPSPICFAIIHFNCLLHLTDLFKVGQLCRPLPHSTGNSCHRIFRHHGQRTKAKTKLKQIVNSKVRTNFGQCLFVSGITFIERRFCSFTQKATLVQLNFVSRDTQ
jgi:hypothetical protein